MLGPASGDLVIDTNEKVVRALVSGGLGAATAEEYGLLQYYGSHAQTTTMRTDIQGATTPKTKRQA